MRINYRTVHFDPSLYKIVCIDPTRSTTPSLHTALETKDHHAKDIDLTRSHTVAIGARMTELSCTLETSIVAQDRCPQYGNNTFNFNFKSRPGRAQPVYSKNKQQRLKPL